MKAKIKQETLTDKSVVYNIIIYDDFNEGYAFFLGEKSNAPCEFACKDFDSAIKLIKYMEKLTVNIKII